MPCPIPEPAPVMSATFPASLPMSEHLRHEARHALQVIGVLRILRRAEAFLEVRTALEEEHQQDATGDAPVQPPDRAHAEQEESDPDRLLGGVVRMAREREQARADEALATGG